MKILHIGDQAGSASITSNICTKMGHESLVLQDKNIETFLHGEYYKNTLYMEKDDMFTALKAAISEGYDHFVYHDQIALATAADHLHVSSSYMFHGNMLRQNTKLYNQVMNLESIDNIFVTTEDLLEFAPEAHLFNRPVDMDMFYNMGIKEKHQIGLCLTQERYVPFIRDMVRGSETGVFIVDRVKNKLEYKNMPSILNQYRLYYDIKYQPTHPPTLIKDISQTALQALACGLTVWSNGKVYTKFPEQNSDENSAREFIRVLEE